MSHIDRKVITKDDFPEWVNLSKNFLHKLAEDSDNILPWAFIDKSFVRETNAAIRSHYPYRELFIFAHREDCDDAACFERSKPNKVIIVYDWEDPGHEEGPEFVSFEAWYEHALKCEHGKINYEGDPGIDYNPHDEYLK